MDVRFRIAIIIFMFLITLVVWAFPVWFPVINQATTAEVFPGLATELQDDFLQLSVEERQAYFDWLDENPAQALGLVQGRLIGDTAAPDVDAEFDDSETISLFTGSFIAIDEIRWAEGDITVYQTPNQTRLLRFEEFSSVPGSDVRVYLSRTANPVEFNELGDDYRDLGGLKGSIGNQNYPIPADVDFDRYPSVVLVSANNQVILSTALLR